jgi:hypothetical protein
VVPPALATFGEPLRDSGPINGSTCIAHVGIALLEGNSDEAMKRALRTQSPREQLRALVLCAEWMANPAQALEEARKIIDDEQKRARLEKRPMELSQAHILRLTQIAAASGMAEQAKTIAGALTDEGIREWALGDTFRIRPTTNTKEKLEASALDRPEDEKMLKVGHIWGLYWIARRNAAESGDRGKEKEKTEAWPKPAKPFGLAGIALGLQDR